MHLYPRRTFVPGIAALLGLCALAQEPSHIAQISHTFGQLPLYFEQNRGQTGAPARYIAHAQNLTAFITNDGLTLASGRDSVSVRIAGANPKTQFTAESPVEGVSNYYLGSRIIEAVPHYTQVRANSIRKNIDLVYHGSASELEYDFILHPGARPSDIRLQLEGAFPTLDDNGDLVVKLGTGELRQGKPKVWQGEGTERREIDCHYILAGKNTVRLALGRYSQSADLVIDPILSYSTFLGGTGSDAATGIAVDSLGHSYLTGYTTSLDFPVTSGALHGSYWQDAFVTCLNPSGTGLVYSTYIGGSSSDEANGIALNAGNAYITGYSSSTDFPITVGQSHMGAFVVKLNSSGTLVYSHVLGTNATATIGNAIAVDSAGAVYITGISSETTFPATTGALRTTLVGSDDAFVAKLNDAGQIVYATYLGGTAYDIGTAIAVDGLGNSFVAGSTSSSNFPTTNGAYATTFKGLQNAFVTGLNPTGSALVYSTYLGSSGNDGATGLALDTAGNCYVVGQTTGSDFPTTPNAFMTSKPVPNLNSAFVSKLNPTGTALVFSTYLGGVSNDSAAGVAVDSNFLPYVVGSASSSNFPTTAGALKGVLSIPNDDVDIFLAQFSADGSSLKYSTLLGSTATDHGAAVALDGTGDVYVAGWTLSQNYPTTAGVLQPANPKGSTNPDGYTTAVASKLDLNSTVTCNPSLSPLNASIPGRGGSYSFQLTLAPGCPWEAVIGNNPYPPFVTFTTATFGMGSASPIAIAGTVPVNNNTSSPVTYTIQIDTATFTINQAQGLCQDPAINPLSYTLELNGGVRTIDLSLPDACPWTASASAPWLGVTAPNPPSGTGPASLTINVPPNSFSTRTSSLTIDGQTVGITQTGSTCSATASATPTSFNGSGGTGVTHIATNPGTCAWVAYSTVPWIQLTSSTSGQGAGTVPFLVAGNPGALPRSGRILMADQVILINQAAGPEGTISSYVTSLFAGQVLNTALGDGGPAIFGFLSPRGLVFDPTTGNLYIADASNPNRVRVVTPDGNINSFAGGGLSTAEDVPPLTAYLGQLTAVGVDKEGAVYLNDGASRIRKIANGNITTFAGGLISGSGGDNGPATSASLEYPQGVTADANDNVFIADTLNYRIREVQAGTITTFAGTGSSGGALGDQGPATSATLSRPSGLAVDAAGNLYIADSIENRVRKVITQAGPSQGTITTVAGGGSGGDGGQATSASLNYPIALAFDPAGSMFIAEANDIRKVAPNGTISTATTSSYVYYYYPAGITSDLIGNVYFSDTSHNAVWMLAPVSAFCTYTVAPVATQPNTGGPLSINVTAATNCNWTASSDASWATISSRATGTGNGTVQLTLTSNTTNQPRTGNINIAGQAVTITQNGNEPSLTVAMMHNGSFRQGQQNANYFVVVSNAATSMPTSAPVVVTDFVPTPLTLVSMSGTGWTCGGNICSRGDALSGGSSYPPITVTVNVAANAPAQVTNQVSVVGGGSTGATIYDPTTIASISISLNVAGCYTATVQGELTHATSWTINPQIGTLEVVPMWIGITPFAGPFDEIDIACYTPSVSGPNYITLTATSEADTGLTTSILLNGYTGQPQ